MTEHAKSHVTINTPIQFQDKLPSKVDVAIIGGGVIGIFSALYLAGMGKRVIVLEKGRIAGEQSSRNWGWVRQQGRDAAELPIMMEAIGLWQDVNAQTNGQCGIANAPINFLSSSNAQQEDYEHWIKLAREHGLESHLLTKTEIGEIFNGHSSEKWVSGITTPSDLRAEPWVAVPAVAQLAQNQGVLIRENCAVRTLNIEGGAIKGVITEHGNIDCEQVVLASGAWSSLFARRHGVSLPQLAVASTAVQTTPLPEFTSQTSLDEGLAIRRRADGGYSLALTDRNTAYVGPDALRHCIGYLPVVKKSWRHIDLKLGAPSKFPDAWGTKRSWNEDDVSPFEKNRVLEPSPNGKHIARIIERFVQRFPNVDRPKISHSWAGMIDTMPDFIPVVDRTAEYSNLIIATGMSGHGFGIGPGFGKIIAQMIAGQTIKHDLSRFRISRFSDGSKLELGPSL